MHCSFSPYTVGEFTINQSIVFLGLLPLYSQSFLQCTNIVMTASLHVGAKLLTSRISDYQQHFVCVCVCVCVCPIFETHTMLLIIMIVRTTKCSICSFKSLVQYVDTVPSCPAGLWRAHSSQRGSASA